jgi:TRAP transporter 4TM/12TM fusion protein
MPALSSHISRAWTSLTFGRLKSLAISLIAGSFSIWQVYVLAVNPPGPWIMRAVHLAFAMTLGFLLIKPHKQPRSSLSRLFDLTLISCNLLVLVYLFVEHENMYGRIGIAPTSGDLIFGLLALFLILELLRRSTGYVLPVLIVISVTYALLGNQLPGLFWNRGYSLERTVSYVFSTQGIYGSILGVSTTYVYLFVLFGAFLQHSRASDFFIDIASSIAGWARGGPAKVAVISSGFMGMISGSAVSNVVVSGSLTIPLMIRAGYSRAFAGAVEAVASSGGQIMPPIMGAAAFLVVDFTGIPYASVVKAAAIPAILYFLSLLWVVDLEAAKNNLKGIAASELPKAKAVLLRSGHMAVPIFVILYFLLVARVSVIQAGLWAILVTILISWLRQHTRLGLVNGWKSLQQAGVSMTDIAVTTAGAGVLVAILALTGLGVKLGSILIGYSNGSIVLGLVLAAVTSLVLGMGMPTTAAYAISATVIAPALIQLGIPVLPAHLFVFYFACMSTITPPIALNAFAAAPIAQESPNKIGYTAFRIGIVSFVIAFMFVLSPGLLMQGSTTTILMAATSAVIGVLGIGVAVQGWLFHRLEITMRIICFIGSILLIHQGLSTNLFGAAILGVVLLFQWKGRERKSHVQPSKPA